MATSVFDDVTAEYRLLVDVLLRLPRHPQREQRGLWRRAVEIAPRLEPNGGRPPVAAVAIEPREEGDTLVVLLADEPGFDPVALAKELVRVPVELERSGRFVAAARPAQGGDSISGDGTGGDTGTLCCKVGRERTGDVFALGCNHTLAGLNRCIVNSDTVRQPGGADRGVPSDRLGTLVDYKTIRLGGYHDNEMDAAIAEPADPNDLDAGVRSIGAITGVAAAPSARARVEKVGWATGYTAGAVRFPTIGAPLEFGSQEALFLKQVAILGDAGAFARRGDSGAAVLIEDAAELAAMVIGVDDVTGLTIATPIQPVLRELEVWPL